MNIVFVCAEYPEEKNSATGGFGRYVESISLGLGKMGHEVTILCKSRKKNLPVHQGNITVIPLTTADEKVERFVSILPLFLRRSFHFYNYPFKWSWQVYRYLEEMKKRTVVDIIEGGDFAGELFFYLLLAKYDVPVVIKLHTPSFVIRKFNQEKLNLFYLVLGYLERFCLQHASFINSPSQSLADLIERKIKRKIHNIIPYPVPRPLSKATERREKHLGLYIGKLQEKKGVFTLLKAIPIVLGRYPKMQFLLVGPDTLHHGISTRKKMKEEIHLLKLMDHVEIADTRSKDKVLHLYRKATIVVVPSLWENFPYTCLEALSCGSTVVASNVGGIPEIIESGKNGFLIAPGNHNELAAKIINLLEEPKLRKKFQAQAKKTIRTKFSVKKISGLTSDFYKSCLKMSPRDRSKLD